VSPSWRENSSINRLRIDEASAQRAREDVRTPYRDAARRHFVSARLVEMLADGAWLAKLNSLDIEVRATPNLND
jgi:hypothetical protein